MRYIGAKPNESQGLEKHWAPSSEKPKACCFSNLSPAIVIYLMCTCADFFFHVRMTAVGAP